ncbi:MAG TPA: hypothetical protein DCZ01_03825 [Elusimicrobia bacterium]|nr:MAG: hypothetical protein A2X40_04800 [Elusimicrobia bacterium GWC2_65_9]HAZ07656.1 hypothetical protein [Elusimicrobiota bacterium]
MASDKTDALILGGGFAGLVCAVCLAEKGRKVLVLEKKTHLGGRAYSFEENGLDIDNGQHLFMGCYRATRRFLKTIGTQDRLEIYEDMIVDYIEPGGKKDRLDCPSWLPAPYHLAAGLLGLKGVSLKEKTALFAFDLALKAMKVGPIPQDVEKMTVRGWLSSLDISRNFQNRFFDPAAIGILNERPEIASSAGFIQALREIFFSDRGSSKFALAKTGLSDLYADAARDFIEKREGRVISTAKAVGLIEEGGRVVGVKTDMDSRFTADHIVSTLPPWELKKLDLPAALHGPWEDLAPAPIIGVTLLLDRPVMSERFVGLLNAQTHWVFNRSRIMGLPGPGQVLSVVISGAHEQIGRLPEKIRQTVVGDLSACLPGFSLAKIVRWKVVKEPFATLSPTPGSEAKRPEPGTGMPGFSFAGDWTRTGLPATIESACVSGYAAASRA